MAANILMLCECNSYYCGKTVNVSIGTAQRIKSNDHIIIVEGCETGPEKTDIFVSKEDGYSVYRDSL